jgi:PAS domain S-box-containing protein
MENVLSLLFTTPSVSVPQTWAGRLIAGIGWLLMAAVVFVLLWQLRRYNKPLNQRFWAIWIVLALLAPISNLFIGFRLSAPAGLPVPWVPAESFIPVLMIFSALPWMLAGGFLGPAGAASIAAIAGVFNALWNTHSAFTPLEMALLATLFGAAMMQRYRTFFYRALRHPVFASLLLSVFYPFIFLITATIASDGSLAVRLDYALSMFIPAVVVVAAELLIAGVVSEVISIGVPVAWGSRAELQPSPAEKSLRARYLFVLISLIFLLSLTLLVGDWIIAGQAAQRILRGRMQDPALIASKGIPFFLGVGQNEIAKLAADPRLPDASSAELTALLDEYLIRVPFFSQYYLLDDSGSLLAEYPEVNYESSVISPDEQKSIQLAIQGVTFQAIAVPPEAGGKAAQISFIQKVQDGQDGTWGVLIARTDLQINPFTAPIINSLQRMTELEGDGMIIDDTGRIVYHSDPDLLMSEYSGRIPEDADFFDEPGSDGTRQWIYYQPTEGQSWAVVLSVPARSVQQVAVDIASPLLVVIAAVAVIMGIFLSLSLNRITASLRELADQSERIAKGKLDEPLNVSGEDEVAQVSRSFEQMRQSLKARLDELNQLLVVVQGVAANLDMEEAVQPILESALIPGACSAHVVLDPAVVPELEGDPRDLVVFSAGEKAGLYNHLNEQIISLTRQQNRLVLTNVLRPRLLQFHPADQRPEGLMAVALRHEHEFYGALWVAYDQVHAFSEEEVRFLVTLGGQAALAAANARLYANAEIGRQRLSAILASTPEPVLVTDQKNRLLLANPAAWRALGLGAQWDEGKPIQDVINHKELLALLDGKAEEKRAAEISLADNRVYYALSTSVIADGRRVGRVCVLRDITSFKELDILKSEFVATVSHDLRSPLTLVRGYASMLEIVGELNEQQKSFVRMIISGVESMTRLVVNLLDLGRIETGVGLKLEMVPVQDVIQYVTNALHLQATQRRIQMRVEIPADIVPLIEADQALLQQAIHNLVDNAIMYTEPGGKVYVKAESHQNEMHITVSDTGIGIAPIDQPRLFEKFYRGAQAGTKRSGGTGLGLAIVKSIADRHGGRVWVEGQLGKGSTFHFVIPIKQAKVKVQGKE